jgi:hypothetical protein
VSLGDAIEALDALEGEIAVHWGDTVFGLVDVIRSESKGLFNYAAAELDPKFKGRVRGYLASAAPPGIAPTYTGRAFERALDLYTDLAQQWLAVHVGRDGARAMQDVELEARRKQVDAEAARLAEPEQLSRDNRAVEFAAWVEQHGGVATLARKIREELETES